MIGKRKAPYRWSADRRDRLAKWFTPAPRTGTALYAAVVERARAPHWYVEGAVPDSVDGRFDMVAAILTVVLLRLESGLTRYGSGAELPQAVTTHVVNPNDLAGSADLAARLTECFVDDMDGQLRQLGIGDIVVGKHIGRMMSMLGGRLGAYRDPLADPAAAPGSHRLLTEALIRNLYRGIAPAAGAAEHVADAMLAFAAALRPASLATLVAGVLP